MENPSGEVRSENLEYRLARSIFWSFYASQGDPNIQLTIIKLMLTLGRQDEEICVEDVDEQRVQSRLAEMAGKYIKPQRNRLNHQVQPDDAIARQSWEWTNHYLESIQKTSLTREEVILLTNEFIKRTILSDQKFTIDQNGRSRDKGRDSYMADEYLCHSISHVLLGVDVSEPALNKLYTLSGHILYFRYKRPNQYPGLPESIQNRLDLLLEYFKQRNPDKLNEPFWVAAYKSIMLRMEYYQLNHYQIQLGE